MKNITQGLLILSVCVLSSQAYSQITALRAGFNLSTLSFSDEFDASFYDYKSTPGFHIGTTFDIPLGEMFAIETGVLLTTKGTQYSTEFDFGFVSIQNSAKLNILNAEIPVSFKTIFGINDNLDVYASAGGYLGVSIIGIERYETTVNGETEKDEEEVFFEEDGFQRLDYGLTFGAGVELKGFIIGASYDLGLANIVDSEEPVRNRVLKIGIGYRFGWDN